MLEDTAGPTGDDTPTESPAAEAPAVRTTRRSTRKTAKKAAPTEAPADPSASEAAPPAPADVAVDAPAADEADRPARKTAAKKAAAKKTAAKKTTAKKTAAKKTAAKKTTKKVAATEAPAEPADSPADAPAAAEVAPEVEAAAVPAPLFQAPEKAAPARRTRKKAAAKPAPVEPTEDLDEEPTEEPAEEATALSADADQADQTDADQTEGEDAADGESGEGGGARRRRRRGGRRRRKSGEGDSGDESGEDSGSEDDGDRGGQDSDRDAGQDARKDDDQGESSGSSRRRRRRRRSGDDGDADGEEPTNTVTRVRKKRSAEDQITAVSGSTRLEAKKQRRREGREAGRRRAPIVSEAEFLARRESVDRTMVIRQRDDLTQIAVLEDKVLVEHYVARESQTSLIGNVYLGRVQNVLPSMEAAFIDIGKGRNAVLYAGEVNWSALGHKDGQPRKIESVLTSGQPVLVQVTKDPIGHKGARLTSQISLAGRFLVYVPDGTTSGISRKLPDTERNRLKALLKEIVPDTAGVIVRTAAEGASEDELTLDVERLKARWEDIEKKAKGSAPQLLYGEPDLTLKVVRDLFTEDFAKLVIEGDDAWDMVQAYVEHVAPDLADRLQRHEGDKDAFAAYRIDEQIAKALDRKVWLPSGGSLVIDRTEAMTVVDVNTGKFTGSGGNLEETVTKNNLEAAEEVVRQLRLRDIGGIIVVDFIDMVLESNRDLVLRRLVECLGRDRTRHQVAEVTSLGLVQMTRKRIGTGLLEAFSETCEHCQGRGLVIHEAPVEPRKGGDDDGNRRARRRGGKGRGDDGDHGGTGNGTPPSPKDVAAMARPEPKAADPQQPSEQPTEQPAAEQPTETPAAQRSAERPTPEPPSERPTPEAPSEQPEPQRQPEPEPTPGPVETKPKVVTRTRRRSASRPAGPPAGAAEVPAMDRTPAAGGVGSPAVSGAVEPGTAAADPSPATAAAQGVAEAPEAHVEHVPVKKKGSRKR